MCTLQRCSLCFSFKYIAEYVQTSVVSAIGHNRVHCQLLYGNRVINSVEDGREAEAARGGEKRREVARRRIQLVFVPTALTLSFI